MFWSRTSGRDEPSTRFEDIAVSGSFGTDLDDLAPVQTIAVLGAAHLNGVKSLLTSSRVV